MRPVSLSKYHAENNKKCSLVMVVAFSFLLLASVFNSSDVDADDSGTCGNGLTYTYVESTGTLTIQKTGSGDGAMENYRNGFSIPWPHASTVIIGDGVTSIGKSAFENCFNLTSITIPTSVTSIGASAFQNCPILSSITIPTSVTSIGDRAFQSCIALTSIYIPSSVTSIGDRVFLLCSSLDSISVDEKNVNYSSDSQGILYDKDKTRLIQCPGKKTSVYVPAGVIFIDKNAFEHCNKLKSVNIPDTVTSIGVRCFNGCSRLSTVVIPASVTSIGDYAFCGCDYLDSIELSDGLLSIGYEAIVQCSIRSINIPASVTSIGDGNFNICPSLVSINVDDNNPNYSSDSQGVFYNKDKTVLLRCPQKLNSVCIPDGVTNIGVCAFYQCHYLTAVYIPDGVKTIGNYGFGNCSVLASINIPDSLTTIGNYGFADCSSIKFLVIGDNVSSIGSDAFKGLSFFRGTHSLVPNANNIAGKTWIGTGDANLYLKETGDPTVCIVTGEGGAVNMSSVSVTSNTAISVKDNVLTIGSNKITATPSDGYEFDSWHGVASANVSSDMFVAASFRLLPSSFMVDVHAEPIEGGSVSGEGSYEPGSTVVLSAVVEEGWKFQKWVSLQVNITNGSFTMPYQDVTVTAIFVKEGDYLPGLSLIHLLVIVLISGVAVGIIAVVSHKKRAGHNMNDTLEKKSEEYSVAQYQEQIDAKKEELRLLKAIATDENQTVKTVKSANACIPKLENEIRDLEAKKQEASRKGLF